MEADIQREIEIFRNEKLKYGLTVQPFIVVVGTISNPEKIFLFINNTKFIAQTFLKALDACFKTHMVLNTQYNFECHQVWEFIQIYIYGIKTSYDKRFKATLTLIAELNAGK